MIIRKNPKAEKKSGSGNSIIKIKESLEEIGYTVFRKVLEARNFGVPQVRKRIYIVAFRNDLKITEFIFPDGQPTNVRLETIIEQEPSEDLFVDRDFVLIDKLQQYEKSCKKPIIRVGKIGQGRQGERIYSIKGCSTTLSSQSGGLGGKTGMYLVNGRIRMLSGRECARAMGFPDNFIIAQTDTLAHTHFGNSVVVNVLQAVVNEIINKLTEGNENG